MANAACQSVDEYIASQPETSKSILHQVRSVIRRSLTGAEETIAYGIPAYKLHGRSVLFFAGWKHHFSIYPAGERLRATFQAELAGYEVRKGTIRFPLSRPVPVDLIERIAKFRAGEAASAESGESDPTSTH